MMASGWKNILLSSLALVLSIAMASGAQRLQMNAVVGSSSSSSSGSLEASSADKMSSSAAVDLDPPRRFHAIFADSSSSTPRLLKPSNPAVAATVEKMLSSGSSRNGIPSETSGSGAGHKTRTNTKLCREGCLQKRSIKDILCTQQRECAMCWDVCNRNHQIRKENELAQRLLLSLSRMIRNESVVTADIEWTTPEELLQHQPHPVVPSPLAASENVERLSRIARDGASNGTNSAQQVSRIIQALSRQDSVLLGADSKSVTSESNQQQQSFHQCLVSWEISGGGLTGNLLTETAKAELSLWPNTKYHVHVTCRNKETDQLIRSPPLLIDTAEAIIVSLQGTTSTTSTTTTSTTTTTTPRPLSINSVIEEIDVIQATSFTDDIEADDEDNSFDGHQNLAQRQDQQNHHRHRLWPMYSADLPENSKEIVILGVFVALLAFVLIVLTVILLVRRKQDQIEDRELLIESEVLPKILHV